MSYNDQLLRIVREYREVGEPWPASKADIAAWAIRTGRWAPQQKDVLARCAEELSRAMREEYITDPQGRRVRAKHAATVDVDGKQQTLWSDIRDPSPWLMPVAFQQRRQHIVSECRQLKVDVDSWNENARPVEAFQLVLDYTDDVAELEAANAGAAA